MTQTGSKSTFVTVLAWIFIVLGGGATAISALQNVMLYAMFPRAEMKAAANFGPGAEQVPAFAKFMFANFELFFLLFFLLSLLSLVAAIGLLKRKNWARFVFIGLMVFGIVWNLGGLVLQQMFMSMIPQPSGAPAELQQQLEVMQTIMQIAMLIFALGFSALFGWIIWRLRSPAIAAEFRSW